MDNPRKYGLTRDPIPYFGGLAIVAAFFSASFVFLPMSQETIALLIGTGCLALVAFFDDRHGLPATLRLGVQILAALLLVLGGATITTITNPFGGSIDLTGLAVTLPFVGIIYLIPAMLITIWVVALTNTLNWLDGLPGLSAGTATVAALIMLILASRPDFHYFDQSAVIMLAGIVAGSAAGFFLWNLHPPRILLGDTGSMPLGFLLAAIAVFSGAKIATAALVLGVPLLDAIAVITRRILRGVSPLRGDLTHLHHRLLAAGLTKRQTVAIILALSLLFGSAALFIETSFGKLLALVVLAIAFFAMDAWLLSRGASGLQKEE